MESKKELKSGTIESIRTLLNTQRGFQPEWLKRYFPDVAATAMVGYDAVEKMSARQAEAVRHLLIEQIIYARRQMRKTRGRGGPRGPPDEGEDESEWPIRAELDTEALVDLCEVYGLPYPAAMQTGP